MSQALIPEATEQVRPLHISVPQEAIDDLRARLRATRFPNEQPVKDWSHGVPIAHARALVQYWESGYDWRRFETELNSFPNFRTLIDGLGIHFIHGRSPHPDALPILLTHGWPGSIAEFIKIVRPLTNPTEHGGRARDAFHVVVPSLPGFGFSDKPTETGWNLSRIASAWSQLMQRLGYRRWVAQGGDWGAGVTTALGHLVPPGLAGIHLNWQFVFSTDMRCRIRRRARRCGSTKNFTVGLTTMALLKTRCRGIKCSTTFHSTGSQTPRHRQHGSTGRIRAAHFQEASSACLSRQPSYRERYTALQRAGPSRPIRISFTGMRLSTAAISPRSSSRTFLSKKCVPRLEN